MDIINNVRYAGDFMESDSEFYVFTFYAHNKWFHPNLERKFPFKLSFRFSLQNNSTSSANWYCYFYY
ncbi:MAG: hypothetical protein WC735_02575 [Candidatus Paceibacterota bacterium]